MTGGGGQAAPAREDDDQLGLLILDDFFPNLTTGFRVDEFNALFRAFPRARCESVAEDLFVTLGPYLERFPEFTNRVGLFLGSIRPGADLAYCVGLNTLELFRPILEYERLPFVLELYPGFGFRLDERESDRRLEAALRSPCFRKVIVTQTVTLEYVQRRFHLPPDRLVYRYGFVDDERSWPIQSRPDPDSDLLELAFVAHKYSRVGVDKGYDVFIDAGRLLLAQLPGRVRLHVVGPWTPDDHPLGELVSGRDIFFHGWMSQPSLRRLHRGVDAIVSPTRAGLLGRGSFDGFPTAATVDAMFCGAAAFVTDPIRINHTFKPGKELFIIEPAARSVADAILAARRSGQLARVAARGSARVRELFTLETQMRPRIDAIRAAAREASPERSGRMPEPAPHPAPQQPAASAQA